MAGAGAGRGLAGVPGLGVKKSAGCVRAVMEIAARPEPVRGDNIYK